MKQAFVLRTILRSTYSNFSCTTNKYATFTNKRVIKEPTVPPNNDKKESWNRFDGEMEDFISSNRNLADLPEFKQSIIKKYNTRQLTEQSFDAIFMRMCLACRNYNMAKAFLDNLTQGGGKANTATLSKFLTLCYFCSKEVQDKSEVEKLCSQVLSQSQYIDASTKESVIVALSTTKSWRDGLKLMAEDQETHHSLPLNAMIDCLLKHDQLEEALCWLEKSVTKERIVFDHVYEHWLTKCQNNDNVWKMFSDFLIRNGVFLKQPLAEQIKSLMENHHDSQPFVGQFTSVDERNGTCLSCHKVLKNADITNEDFGALQKAFMEKVVCGKDIFLGTKPGELQNYEKLIQKTAPYDIVIDGLNVAYHTSAQSRSFPSKKSELLQSVVDHFAKQNKKILVLTRKHLLREPVLSRVKKRAYVFATEDLSLDDPFLLYAALQSKHTKFVSDDVFRDHLFLLNDSRLEMIFRVWQHSAQIQIVRFNRDGTVVFHHPRPYRTVTQVVDGHWHIPYDDGTPRYRYQVPTTWLCLKPKSVSDKS